MRRLLTVAVICLPTMAHAELPREHAARFCPTLGKISYAIMMGRQEGRGLRELLQYANAQREIADLAAEIVADVWSVPIYPKTQRSAVAQHYGESILDACWAGTPR